MNIFKRFLPVLLILTLLLSSCEGRGSSSSDASSADSSSAPEFNEQLSEREAPVLNEGDPVSSITPDHLEDISEKHDKNSDTIGWLWIPGTSIDDVVLQREGDLYNQYYERKDFNQNYYFYGVYYADSRAVLGNGSREGLGVNTCIYGHSIADEENDERFKIKFGQLHRFRDPDFAREHPYIFFSTAGDGGENMAFEVVAVFTANADNLKIPYNSNPSSGAEFVKMVKEQVLPRSKYVYDVELNDDDKFLTMSTCIYTLDNGVVTGYPNTMYRYAVMARLMDEDEPIKNEAQFVINENVLYDPDGRMSG